MYFRFDFDGDNLISPDEVFILLSYIPFKNSETIANNQAQQELSPATKSPGTLLRQSSTESMRRNRGAQAPMNEE